MLPFLCVNGLNRGIAREDMTALSVIEKTVSSFRLKGEREREREKNQAERGVQISNNIINHTCISVGCIASRPKWDEAACGDDGQ